MTGVSSIDRDALHRYLWRRANRAGRLRIVVRELADELELGYANLTVVIGEMCKQGRLIRVGGGRNQTKTYRVVDPAEFEAKENL